MSDARGDVEGCIEEPDQAVELGECLVAGAVARRQLALLVEAVAYTPGR